MMGGDLATTITDENAVPASAKRVRRARPAAAAAVLFLGLVDLAIINSYIIYNAVRAAANLPNMSHVKFLKHLHLELCQLQDEDWAALCSNQSLQSTPSKELETTRRRHAEHIPLQNDGWRSGNNNHGRKRRTRVCKVCSLLKDTDNDRGGASSTYCSKCKLQTASKKPMVWRVFLCEKKRHTVKGELLSCFDIWHRAWRDGTLAPMATRGGKRSIRARGPARTEEDGKGGESDEEASDESKTSSVPPKRARRVPDRRQQSNQQVASVRLLLSFGLVKCHAIRLAVGTHEQAGPYTIARGQSTDDWVYRPPIHCTRYRNITIFVWEPLFADTP
ncbi:hypothetical protein ON010_g7396 [Phytophthora cinnamomi]|nr:hypothetical protein ON010_g7396 [Phytophthora cinnamomi]